MAVIHISKAEAVRAGSEVIIERDLAPVVVLVPLTEQNATPIPEHDAWFHSMVQQALDDIRPDCPSDEVEAHFAQRRVASLLKIANFLT